MFDEFKLHRNIICIDFKSFYATVECNLRNLDPLTTSLVVSDESRGKGAITLAASPYVKQKYKIKSRSRLFELPDNIEDLIIAKPNMQLYVETSRDIIKLYLEYFSRNDIYIYSIDEVFIDVTDYLKFYKKDARQIALMLMKEIYLRFRIYSTCGIGPNMLLAKFALDIDSKHNKDWISIWDYSDIENKLWKMTEFKDIWGIGRRKEKRLRKLGCYTVKDIVDLGVEKLNKEFGILGEEMYLHLHGIDISRIQDQNKLSKRKSYGIGQTLHKNIYNDNVLVVLKEMAYDECLKLVEDKKKCKTVHISFGYSKESNISPTSKQYKLPSATNDYIYMSDFIEKIFNQVYVKNTGVRKLYLTFSGLTDKKNEQISLFGPRSNNGVDEVLIDIRKKYGKNAMLLGTSFEEEATSKERNNLIGGHHA